MRERLVKLLQNFADGTYTSNGIIVDGTPQENIMNYCPHCGAKMDGGAEK